MYDSMPEWGNVKLISAANLVQNESQHADKDTSSSYEISLADVGQFQNRSKYRQPGLPATSTSARASPVTSRPFPLHKQFVKPISPSPQANVRKRKAEDHAASGSSNFAQERLQQHSPVQGPSHLQNSKKRNYDYLVQLEIQRNELAIEQEKAAPPKKKNRKCGSQLNNKEKAAS